MSLDKRLEALEKATHLNEQQAAEAWARLIAAGNQLAIEIYEAAKRRRDEFLRQAT